MNDWLEEPRPVVPWDTMGEPLFSRLIEVLVFASHADDPGAEIRVVNGRGGDDGVDIRVRTGKGRILIYQLKYFPQGFDGKEASRRQQISSSGKKKGSLETAIANVSDMDEWVLVAPCAATQSGWAFIDKLRKKNQGLTISFMDRAAIEARWVAPHRDVVRTIVSESQTLELTRLYNQERTMLAGGLPDQAAREEALERVARSADPDWYWDLQREGRSRVHVLTPQHPRAQERSPVSIGFTAKVPDGPAGVALRRAHEFGIVDSLEIPREAVQSFTLEGPPIVRSAQGEMGGMRIVALPGQGPEVPMTLEIGIDDDPARWSFPGLVKANADGTRGVSIRQALCNGAVVMTWFLPRDVAGKASTDITVAMDGLTPHSTRRVTRLLLALSKATRVHLKGQDGAVNIRMRKPEGSFRPAFVREVTVIDEVAGDLLFLEAALEREFPMPIRITGEDRIDLRMLRHLIEGKVTAWPEMVSLGLQLRPEVEDQIEGNLDDVRQFVVRHEEFAWQIEALSEHGDQGRVTLTDLRMLLPQMRINNLQEVQDALRAGQVVDVQATPVGQMRPRLFLGGSVAEDTIITPHPWGLAGVDESWRSDEAQDETQQGG